MSHARDLLTLLLSVSKTGESELSLAKLTGRLASQPQTPLTNLPATPLSSSTISKPPPIPSVVAFNGQLALGSKDASLRRAAQLLSEAAESTNILEENNRNYWGNAQEIRSHSWGFIPAPLPYGGWHLQGRGGERTTKDCLISFGLEGGLSPFVTHLVQF
jgi:mediator of RNA polymerase II transcription subunit 17